MLMDDMSLGFRNLYSDASLRRRDVFGDLSSRLRSTMLGLLGVDELRGVSASETLSARSLDSERSLLLSLP